MKDLGKTIAKYRKEHKLNQSQLAKELENYDIYVKQNSISAWELGTATPNAVRNLFADAGYRQNRLLPGHFV